ncbi:MAG: hypothetical protein U0R44_00935 [Candidatus Micrarchaeia archaeon]
MPVIPAKKTETTKIEKVAVTPELRKIWLRVRSSWNLSLPAFSNTLSSLSDAEAGLLYGLVRHSLFKGSHVEILRAHPELRSIVKTDDDRICMHDIYETLSWRLGKSETPPPDVKLATNVRSRLGRGMPVFDHW